MEEAKPQNPKGPQGGRRSQKKSRDVSIETNPLMGMVDVLPEEMKLRNWLFNNFSSTAESFGFSEYDVPFLERQELWTKKSGEEIVEQMYAFKDGEESEVTLRPELTPSLTRLILKYQKKGQQTLLLPLKWFNVGPCWRFESTTRGRRRQFYQWNMDIWGVSDVTAEAELVATMIECLKKCGLTKDTVQVKVSSRKLLESFLATLDIKGDEFKSVCVIIDKFDKIFQKEERIKLLKEENLSDEAINEILNFVSLKNLKDFPECCSSTVTELNNFFEFANAYGYGDWVQFDISVVRGLAYYTGIVFEAFAIKGDLKRALCGGGRYDNIMATYNSPPIPAVGFAIGDCVISEILQDNKLVPEFSPPAQDVVIAFDESLRSVAIDIATKLRNIGRTVDLVLEKKKFKWIYSYIDRVNAERAVLIAPDEWSKGLVRVKKMRLEKDAENKEVDVTVEELLLS